MLEAIRKITHTKSYHKGHPNPQCYRDNYVSLNGEWKFVFDENDEGLEKHYETNFPDDYLLINVPYPYQSVASKINLPDKQCDVIWYEKEINIKSLEKVNRITFLGVDYKTTVFVNGKKVLFHEGGYNAFTVDLTPHVNLGINKVTLRVEDTMRIDQIRGKQRWRKHSFTCFYTETSGIVRDVYLEELNKTHIDKFTLKADSKNKTLKLNVKTTADDKVQLKVKVSDKEDKEVVNKVFEINPVDEILITFDDINAWSFNNPYLYDVLLELIKNDEVCDKVLTYVGFTHVHAENKRIYINGEDTYLKLVLDQGYYLDTLTTPTEEEIIKDVELMIDAGFNGLRIHEKIASPIAYYYLDLYGLYVWQECPSAHGYSYDVNRQFYKQMPLMVEEHLSHPCIIAYVLFNESWGINEIRESKEIQEFTVEMYHLIKKIVDDRFVISNDGWEHTVSDLITFHNYSDTYEELFDTLDSGIKKIKNGENAYCIKDFKKFFAGDYRYQNQPLIFSEFAGIAFDKDTETGWGYGKSVKDEEAFLKRYGDQLRFIYEQKDIRGFCMTQLTDVHQEKNGVFTEDRRPKIPLDKLFELHNKFK